MAKLNCYCINAIARKFDMLFIFMDRKGYRNMPFDMWDKLRIHVIYTFEDRYDNGYDINRMISLFKRTKYQFVYRFLKELKNYQFEDHKVTKVSDMLLISLIGAKEGDKIVYVKRYYTKQFRLLKRNYSVYFK